VDEMNEADFEKASQIVRDYLTEYPEAPFANVGWHFAATIEEYYLGNDQKALDAMRKAYVLGFALESKSDVYVWQMANLALEQGDLEDAVEYFAVVVKSFPRSKYRWVSREKLKELAEGHPEMNIEIPALTAYGEV
jgi:outer membrane protein assembly factor BamD (BamD/ComL family)